VSRLTAGATLVVTDGNFWPPPRTARRTASTSHLLAGKSLALLDGRGHG
jgi:hypothetical protein